MTKSKEINRKFQYFSPKLIEKLNEIKNVSTTIMEAPSGYGKTTAVQFFRDSIMHKNIPFYWFTTEEEPVSKSWVRFCKEIKKIDCNAGSQLLDLGFPDEDTVGEVAQIFRILDSEKEVYLIVDNFQFLQDKLPQAVWLAFINHITKKLHLILLTQHPFNQITNIIGNSNILYITANDLRLTTHDIQKYYSSSGIQISKSQAETLERYTAGWIVALYLQLVNYIESGYFSYSNSIFDLIEDVFWNKLNATEHDFLLSLSQFNFFTMKQANYMMDFEKLPSYAKNLIKYNVFIQYDDATHHYYFDSILSEFLKLKFEEKQEAYQKNILNKSGEWYKSNGQILLAFQFFNTLKDYEKILSLNITDTELSQTVETGFYESIIDILSGCPYDIKCKYPMTLIQIALELFGAGFYEEYGNLCGEIEAIIQNLEMSQEDKNKLYGELSLIYSFSQFNDIEKMCIADKQAYELLNGCTSIISITEPWTFGSPSVLYMFHREAGALEKEVACLYESLPYYSKLTKGHGRGADVIMHSEILLYQGEWEEAEILSHKAAYLAKANDQDSIWLCSILILARISIIHGELEEYRNCMNQLEECFKISSKKSSRMTIDMIKAFLSNSLNEPDDVADWIKAGDINQKRLFDVAIPFAQMVYFKNLLLQKEYKRLIALSEEFIANCEMIHFLLPQIYIKIYTAIAYYSLGNTKRAIILLKTAFDLSLPDKLYLPFVENSELIGDLLYKTLDGQHSDFLIQHNRLSALYHDGKTLIHKEYYKSNLPFGLTAREYEIAKLASIGFQNREIAEKLFISENTVKQYLKNIFQKLNINKRSSIKHLL